MMNKRIISAILLLIMLLNLASCGNSDPDVPDGCVKISADGIGYSFYMVKDWVAKEKSGMTSAIASETDSSNVSMMGFDAGEALSAEDYWNIFSEELKNSFKEISFEEEGTDTTLGGLPAKKYIYNAKVSDVDYKIMQVVCYISNTTAFTSQPEVYVYTYTAFADKYDEHIEDVLYMAECVKFE